MFRSWLEYKPWKGFTLILAPIPFVVYARTEGYLHPDVAGLIWVVCLFVALFWCGFLKAGTSIASPEE